MDPLNLTFWSIVQKKSRNAEILISFEWEGTISHHGIGCQWQAQRSDIFDCFQNIRKFCVSKILTTWSDPKNAKIYQNLSVQLVWTSLRQFSGNIQNCLISF